jgi:hypothetical protein
MGRNKSITILYPIHFDFFNAGQGIDFGFQRQLPHQHYLLLQDHQTVFAMNLSLATAALSSHLR